MEAAFRSQPRAEGERDRSWVKPPPPIPALSHRATRKNPRVSGTPVNAREWDPVSVRRPTLYRASFDPRPNAKERVGTPFSRPHPVPGRALAQDDKIGWVSLQVHAIQG